MNGFESHPRSLGWHPGCPCVSPRTPPESGGRPPRRRRSIRARSRCIRTCGGSVAADYPRPRAERIPSVSLRRTASHLDITAGAVSATIPTLPFWPDPSPPPPLHFQAIHATAMTASRRSNTAASLAATRVPLRRIAPLFMVYDLGGGGGVSIASPISDAVEVLILPQYRPFAHILHSEEPLWSRMLRPSSRRCAS